jgi:TonB family protein
MIALIIEAALRSVTLSVIVWLAMLALRPRNPHLQKTVWITVLLASLVMPFVLKTRVAPSFELPTSVITLTQSMAGATGEAHGALWPAQLSAITIAYCLVVAALLARFAIGLFATWRIRHSATPLPNADGLDIRVSAEIASPATFGSTILLPSSSAGWSESTLAAILSHERSHVRYWDCYVQWLARAHACVFWFNPLAWWLSRRLADLAETTSDDAVLNTMPDRTAYADLLLEIARHPAPTLVTSAARSNISARIERIISDIPPALPPRRWVRGAAVASLIPLFVLAAATAQSPPSPGQTAPPGAGDSADPMAPKMVSWSNDEDNYPTAAKRRGIEGVVLVNATIDAEGVVTYVQVVEEDPATDDYGFAEAAINTAKQVRFSNPTRQPRQVTFKVKFELTDKHQADAPLPTAPINAAPRHSPSPPADAHSPR